MVLWDECFNQVASEYKDVQSSFLLVDAAAMDLVRKPEHFDVMVASNLFGDILTDLAAIVTGTIGLASSANINPTKDFPSMFEPVHGSAPDIAGKGMENPMAAVLSGALMLEHLGLYDASLNVNQAVAKVLKAGAPRTPDLGGKASTKEITEAILAAL
jgi:tartrate dehydrogenase/decarboxylase/D-malate dehydrogenase